MKKEQILDFVQDINTPCKTAEIAMRFDMSVYQAAITLHVLKKREKSGEHLPVVGPVSYGWQPEIHQQKSPFNILCKCLFSEVTVQAVTELDNKAAHYYLPVPQLSVALSISVTRPGLPATQPFLLTRPSRHFAFPDGMPDHAVQ